MLKFACFINGDDYKIVVNETPASRKKIKAMGLAILLPVTIWLVNGFVLSYEVLKARFFWAFTTALVCGFAVFVIEKLIIMAKGNGWLIIIRIAIGLIIAFLGSIAIDEVLFETEIDSEMPFLKQAYVKEMSDAASLKFETSHNYYELNSHIAEAQARYDASTKAAIDEADGTNGTKARGVGKITNFKNAKAKERKIELDVLNAEKQDLDISKDSVVSVASKQAANSFNQNGLLIRVEALFNVIHKDAYMCFIYWLFTALMFFFEFMVIILKLTWQKTNYEKKVELIEEIGQRRIEHLKQKDVLLADPGFSLRELKDTQMLLDRKRKVFS